MAESVNDVATVQQNLLKNLDDANAAITVAQARLNRGLQQELMGVRMMLACASQRSACSALSARLPRNSASAPTSTSSAARASNSTVRCSTR